MYRLVTLSQFFPFYRILDGVPYGSVPRWCLIRSAVILTLSTAMTNESDLHLAHLRSSRPDGASFSHTLTLTAQEDERHRCHCVCRLESGESIAWTLRQKLESSSSAAKSSTIHERNLSS